MKILTARYCKDSFVAIPEDSRDKFKGRESYLLDALNGRYSHRNHGYVLPNSRKPFLEALLSQGWDGKPAYFRDQPHRLVSPEGVEHTAAQAKKLLLG